MRASRVELVTSLENYEVEREESNGERGRKGKRKINSRGGNRSYSGKVITVGFCIHSTIVLCTAVNNVHVT